MSQGEHEVLIGHLIERKTVEDLAASIVDGRQTRQSKHMRRCQQCLKMKTLTYIIEGASSADQVLSCGLGCCSNNCVGRCGNSGAIEVANAVEDLQESKFFSVEFAPTIVSTVKLLASIHVDLQRQLDTGQLDLEKLGTGRDLGAFNEAARQLESEPRAQHSCGKKRKALDAVATTGSPLKRSKRLSIIEISSSSEDEDDIKHQSILNATQMTNSIVIDLTQDTP